VMIWVYDKRACNGADFVYVGLEAVRADSEIGKVLVSYTRGVLDAMGIKNGPTHGEVMMTKDGPCLVEINCRAHGGDGSWMRLARALTGGYSQIDATIDAFLDAEAFEMLPDVPPSPFKASGQELLLVSFCQGHVVSMPGFDKIRQLKSFLSMDSDVAPGSFIEPSVDLFTCLGSVFLMHDDPDVMAADLKTIRDMETECTLFELKEDQHDDTADSTLKADSALLEFKAVPKECTSPVSSKEAPHLPHLLPIRKRTWSGPSIEAECHTSGFTLKEASFIPFRQRAMSGPCFEASRSPLAVQEKRGDQKRFSSTPRSVAGW